MPFLNGPKLDYIGGGMYATNGETVWDGYVRGKHYHIVVPSGFPTDLASIPRIFWSLLPANGWWEKAAVIHDRLCVELSEGVCGISSREVDDLFRRISYEEVVDNWLGARIVSWILWVGVRWGALAPLKRHAPRRPGWWRDAPLVLALTAVLAVVTIIAVRSLDWLVHAVV